MIYADHAATTPVSLQALSAMMPYFTQASGNPSALYHLGRQARHAVEKARADIASCLHAQPEQIFFTSGGTESDNWALRAAMCIHPSKTIVTTRVEHHAVLQTCQALKREGVQIRFCEVDDKGVVSKCAPEVLCGAGLVSVMLANNEIGSIEPVQEIAAAAHAAGALVHTDAVQAVGHIPVHVDVLDVDFLSASAHKFNGPKGIGFLFARDPSSLRPLLYGGGQEHGMRSGTENVPAIAGMAAALQAHNAAMKKNTLHLQKLERVTKSILTDGIPQVQFQGAAKRIPGSISVSLPYVSAEKMLHYLDLHEICVSSGSACNAKRTETSHVLRAIGLPEFLAQGTLRITYGYENTQEEAIQLAKAIVAGYGKLKR